MVESEMQDEFGWVIDEIKKFDFVEKITEIKLCGMPLMGSQPPELYRVLAYVAMGNRYFTSLLYQHDIDFQFLKNNKVRFIDNIRDALVRRKIINMGAGGGQEPQEAAQ